MTFNLSKYAQSTDTEYLDAVANGDTAKAQGMVDAKAKANGYTVGPVWHGGAGGFHSFDWSKIGQQGTSEGKGFYFTNDRSLAAGYAHRHGGRPMRVYLMGGNPIDAHRLTFTRQQVKKILLKLHEDSESAERYSSVLFNFGDVDGEGLGRVLSEAVSLTLSSSEDDASLIAGLITAGADPELLYRAVKEVTGKTGIVEADAWERKGMHLYVATSASHVKLADPVTRDDAGDVVPLSKRFDKSSPDIRF